MNRYTNYLRHNKYQGWHMKTRTTKNAITAAIVAGTLALGAPAAGLLSTATAQTSYSPTFSSKEYVENVNSYANQFQEALAQSGKTASDESLTQIFDIPFKDGKAVEEPGYKPTFSSAATGDTKQEREEFKTRALEFAQQLSDPDLDKAIAKIFGDGAPIDLDNTVAVPEATVNPDQQGEEVNEPAAPPVVNENSVDNSVASADNASTVDAPVDGSDQVADASVNDDENDQAEIATSPQNATTETYADNDTSNSVTSATEAAPQLANTGASVTLLAILGSILTGAGAFALRRNK